MMDQYQSVSPAEAAPCIVHSLNSHMSKIMDLTFLWTHLHASFNKADNLLRQLQRGTLCSACQGFQTQVSFSDDVRLPMRCVIFGC